MKTGIILQGPLVVLEPKIQTAGIPPECLIERRSPTEQKFIRIPSCSPQIVKKQRY